MEFAFFQNLQPVRSSVDPASGRYIYSGGSAARAGAEPARKPSPAAPIANDVPHLRPSAQHDPDLAPTHLALLPRDVPNRAHVTAQPTASRNGSTNRYTVCAEPSTTTAYSA